METGVTVRSDDALYPPGPEVVPAELTRPTRSYKLRAWLAMAALLGFVALYVTLAGWFSWLAYRLVRDGLRGGQHAALGFIAAVPAAFFAVFLVKGLFFVKRGGMRDGLIEITPDEQPRLFAFIHRVAADAGAPRPHRVYLSAQVNAAVFYDLSLLNLLLPTRKNLEIGLGLVNVLSVSELKAVLAHEFGHFAQRTMAVGRWVYISYQVAGAIIQSRGALDRFLLGLSGIDIRIAWIGWIMRVVVWAIRAVLDTAFRLVVMAERALSQEMEFNADLVSVSVAGSDALVHGLHKAHAADAAWDQAVGFVAGERGRGRRTPDLFAIQTRFVEHVRRVLADEAYGRVPALPERDREAHRVFKAELGQPPRMWSTHPPNRAREDNAKRHYLAVPLSDASAWAVFDDPAALRAQMTSSLHTMMTGDKPPPELEEVSIETSLERLDEEFDRASLDRRYHGVYLGRSPVRHLADAKQAYADLPSDAALEAALDALYPEELGVQVKALRDLEEEHGSLEALRDGFLTAPGGMITHRGRMMRPKDLDEAIDVVAAEREAAKRALRAHDQACRTACRAAARAIGEGWDKYLHSLVRLLHYATHLEANVSDAAGHLANVWAVVSADRRITDAELRRLVVAGDEVHRALEEIDRQRTEVVLPEALKQRLEVESWSAVIGEELRLPPPAHHNMGDWLGVVDSWIGAFEGALGALRRTTLDLLLEVEGRVVAMYRGEVEVEPAPQRARVPKQYTTMLEGQERPRQTKLDWWDRFQTADGLVPSVARFAVAGAIVGAVLAAGGMVGAPEAVIYNGLERSVVVELGREVVELAPQQRRKVELPAGARVAIKATTTDGQLIEAFDADFDTSFGTYVYNVAGASPLVEWTAHYGTASPVPPRYLGAPRWSSSEARHIFEEPPTSVSTKGSGATRTALAALANEPFQAVMSMEDEAGRRDLLLAHARWDDLECSRTAEWFQHAMEVEGFAEVVKQRLDEQPRSVVLLRLEQDVLDHDAACARHTQLAEAAPEDMDLRYLRLRCMTDASAQNEAFLAAHDEAPGNPWLSMAAGAALAQTGAYHEALPLLKQARTQIPFLTNLVDDEARLRRADGLSTGAMVRLEDLQGIFGLLDLKLSVERGDKLNPGSPAMAYHELSRGNLAGALSTCGPTECPQLAILVAASDGASDLQIEAAPLDGVTPPGIADAFAGLALARKRHLPDERFVAAIQRIAGPEAPRLLAFANPETLRADPAAAEAGLSPMRPIFRGEALAMGVVILGDEAPSHWRSLARALLFADERPYFR